MMIFLLKYAVLNKINIVMIQEPYYDNQKQLIINHSSYQSILFKIFNYKLRVITYVIKFN